MKRLPIILLGSLICFSLHTKAEKLHAQIITNNNDTIKGYVKNYWFSKSTGNVIFNGIDLSNFQNEISFKQPKGSYKHYKPEDIQGFSFKYDGQFYTFNSFLVQKKSIIKKEEEVYKFLLLKYAGNISLYSDLTSQYFTDNRKDTQDLTKPTSYSIPHYYLYSETLQLTSIDTSNNFDATFKLLINYGIESEFIEKYCVENKVYDIIDLFQKYLIWKSMHKESQDKNT